MPFDFLKLSERTLVLPVIHGSGDFAVEVRRIMLTNRFDCVALPLPESFRDAVEDGVERLPEIHVAVQREVQSYQHDLEETACRVSYVPIDPCQAVIAAVRLAMQERIPRAYIDRETHAWEPSSQVMPDPYALKRVSVEQFAIAALPSIDRPTTELHRLRCDTMGHRVRELEKRYRSILLICSIIEWPWIREAYTEKTAVESFDGEIEPAELFAVNEGGRLFMLGELPFITGLYETARNELDDDENLSVEGLKQLLLATRDKYQKELKSLARKVTPKLLASYFKYIRNLSLIENRLTPDFYTLIIAAKQIFGDQFAAELAEVACIYPFQNSGLLPEFRLSVGRGQLPDGDMCEATSRLCGSPMTWRTIELKRKPPEIDKSKWQKQWNPYRQCSWPPEDVAIEKFRNHVKDVALGILGSDLARSEKFSTSLKDGLDIRETLRNWHTGDLYVKVFPPQIGTLDCVLMLFDTPADPRDYPWRITWVAEHHDESTLALFATDFQSEMIGPGIGLAKYGGCLFLFPPREIVDVWSDPRLDFADTMEERLLGAACLNSRERHIAVLSEPAPGAVWKRVAKKFGKKLLHVPMGRFSQATIQQLRMVHVLNGKEIRSFASHFIRRS